MKLILKICLLLLPITGYSDYIRTGPVQYESCLWSFVIEICGWKEADSYLRGGKLYQFKTRYDNREIIEVVNNGKICYSNTVPGIIYYKGEKKSRTDEIRFNCRSVR
tara:strand:- start:407 stop:727 length:321 start_codon:yes stop_codon:yes gene_type:complete